MAPIKSNNGFYNDNGHSNRDRVTPETQRQVGTLEKNLSSIDATSAKIVKKISEIIDKIKSGSEDTSKLLEDLTTWTHRLNDVVDEQIKLNILSDETVEKLKAQNTATEESISLIRQQNQEKLSGLAEERNAIENHTKLVRAQNEQYTAQTLRIKAGVEKEHERQTLFENQLATEGFNQKTYDRYVKSVQEELKLQAQLTEQEETKAALRKQAYDTANRVNRVEAAKKSAEQKDSFAPLEGLRAARDAFSINKEAGMSPVKALMNIKEAIQTGNDEQKESFKALSGVLTSGFNALNTMIDNAARLMESSYGRVNAAIDGTGKTFSDYVDNMSNLGISTLIKQEDLLQNLSNVATQGITSDLEQIALLTTIKDKTVASFDATDGNLRRLVRLNQNLGNLTAKQFGLAAVLRTELNAAFGDSSFIGRQFQQLTGTLLDAVSANALKGSTDSTNFYAVMETFAAGMYEAGVDEGTVSSIAQGINYLGSGNVQALSGNKALQNLLLLSMDRAGLDYATILQQGLNTKDTYLLLSEIIDYLADITDSTKKNNVLQSSYANLFNLSITDMSAIRNLSQNSTFRNYANRSLIQNGNEALNYAKSEMLAISDERTMFSEVLNNFVENTKFSLGAGVANSTWAYPLNLIARLGIQAGKTLTDVGLSAAGKATTLASGLGYAASVIPGVMNLVNNLGTNFAALGPDSNTISQYFDFALSNGSGNGGMYDGGTGTARSISKASNFKRFDTADTYGVNAKSYADTATWEADQKAAEEDPNTKILKELEKTLMKAKDSDGYAFAVSLQGMSDGVLRSFASIFADEDAMMETMTGKNNALEKNNTFIDYVNDSSTKVVSAKSGSSAK